MPDFQKVYIIKAPMPEVWDFMADIRRVGKLIPGCKGVETVNDKTSIITVQAKVGLISANFKIKTNIVEAEPPSLLVATGKGEDSRMASFIDLKNRLSLKSLSEKETEVTFKTQAAVSGRLGGLGWGVMKKKAEKMAEIFVSEVKKALE